MSNTPPDYDEVEEGSPFGGAECDESSPEPQPSEDQEEENLYPFDNLAVEYYEDPGEASGSKVADLGETAFDVNAAHADSTDQILDENTDALHALEPDVQVNEEESYQPDYNDLQKTYFEDFMYSNTSSFDEGSNSTFDDTREEPKGSPLGRFSKIVKAVEIAEYETLQVLYQLLYQRSAWDTQQILTQRILEFSGFNFSQKSEDYFNREMMLRTQPNEVLVKIGALLGLHQIQRMLFDMDSGRVDLISGIMLFLSRPNKKTHAGIKCEGTSLLTPQEKPSTSFENNKFASSVKRRKRGSSAPLRQSKHLRKTKKIILPESSPSSSEDESSSDSIDDDEREENSNKGANRESEILQHDTKWLFGKRVSINKFKDSEFPPRLHVEDPKSMSELEYWKLFFPTEEINYILSCINKNLREKRREVCENELYKFIGILYAMSQHILPNRRDYWATENSGLFPAPAFGSRYGMGLHRFEEIMMCLSFSPDAESTDNDKWFNVRPLVNMVTRKWSRVFSPGFKITVDESMFSWYGKGNFEGGIMKIKRKPKGVGCIIKTVADSCSRIMIGMEINEGREKMQKKRWQQELGAGTATTLRLTEPWHGSGRIVVGDSWFGSVKTAVELMNRGLFFIGMVKTAHKNYPLTEFQQECPPNKGGFVSATAEVNKVDLLALSWRDRKVHSFISTCSTTNSGNPCYKKRYDEVGQPFKKPVGRPKLVEEYCDGSPAIDIQNHIRQGGLALEQVWRTRHWEHKMFASIFGIIETNAFLAFNFFKRGRLEKPISHRDFTCALALQLINNGSSSGVPVVQNQNIATVRQHTLVPLSTNDARKRVQRKCVICSRVHHKQVKASYYCSDCGPQAVLCSPQTGRMCYASHINNGLPL